MIRALHLWVEGLGSTQFALEPVTPARTRDDGEAKVIAGFNPDGFYAAILPLYCCCV